MEKITSFFNLEKCLILLISTLFLKLETCVRTSEVTFAEKPQMKINSFQKRKHEYLIQRN